MSCFEVACSVNNVIIVWGSSPELLVSNLTYNWMLCVWSFNARPNLSLVFGLMLLIQHISDCKCPFATMLHVALTAQCPTSQSRVQIMYVVWRSLPAFAALLFNCLMVQIVSCLMPHMLFRTELFNCEQENLPHDVLSNLIVFVSYV